MAASRVRIELCDIVAFTPATGELHGRQGAEIWLSDDEGKIRRTRKPVTTLVGDTRPEVLRQIADWIEDREDPSLTVLAADLAAKRGGAS